MLTLFMAGILQPADCSADDPLMKAYEAAVRRAFRKEINEYDEARIQVSSMASAPGRDPDEAEDDAFKAAQALARHRSSSRLHRLEQFGADLGGFQPRTRAELEREWEQSLLSAVGLRAPGWDLSEDERGFEEIWHNGLVPLDVAMWAGPPCSTCAARTAHMPTSLQGQHDILDSVCFCQLNRARAIGGSVCTLVANLRDQALRNPDDQVAQDALKLCSNTVFRFLIRGDRKVHPGEPGSIVPATLFFLHDCHWLRTAAVLLIEIALRSIPSAKGDRSIPVAVAAAMNETLNRGTMLRKSRDAVGILLAIDGILQAGELLKLRRTRIKPAKSLMALRICTRSSVPIVATLRIWPSMKPRRKSRGPADLAGRLKLPSEPPRRTCAVWR
jgi:hypothetical protein